jgi:hypothetical protein
MPGIYQSDWWSVQVPDGWFVQPENECIFFFAETRSEPLQINAARKEFGEVTAEDLRELSSDHIQDDTNAVSIIVGEFQRRTASWVSDEIYSRCWWLRSGRLLVYVTHNRSIDDECEEDVVVESIVSSLKLRLE